MNDSSTNYEQSEQSRHGRKLYRSRSDRMIGGVCAGFAEYFNIDPVIVRIGWVLATLFGGAGIIGYIAALIIIPDNPNQEFVVSENKNKGQSAKFWGTLLVILGGVLLLRQTGVFYYFDFWDIPWRVILAVLLIAFGVFIIFSKKSNHTQNGDSNRRENETHEKHTIYRIRRGKMVSGVCTGLAEYFDVDVTLVRLFWVIVTLISGGLGIIAYIIAIIALPERLENSQVHSQGGQA